MSSRELLLLRIATKMSGKFRVVSRFGRLDCDKCVELNSTFDVTLIVVGALLGFSLVLIIGFMIRHYGSKNTSLSLTLEFVAVTAGFIGDWSNWCTDLATLINVVQPNSDLQNLVLPVILCLSAGGLMNVAGSIVSYFIIRELCKQVSERKSKTEGLEQRLKFLEDFTKQAERFFRKLDLNKGEMGDMPGKRRSISEWNSALEVLHSTASMPSIKYETISSLPSMQCDSLINGIRKSNRKRNLAIMDACELLVQVVPMFIITAGPIMSQAPLSDVRGWVFRVSLIIGAMSVGAKLYRVSRYFENLAHSEKLQKQLCLLMIGIQLDCYSTRKRGKVSQSFDSKLSKDPLIANPKSAGVHNNIGSQVESIDTPTGIRNAESSNEAPNWNLLSLKNDRSSSVPSN
eukprot:jgi/Bigna1/142255/aug1.68_g16963